MERDQIDQKIYELYDEYCHGEMDRREFLKRAGAITVAGGVSGLAMAEALLPQYARAQTISFTDSRIKARYVTYDSPGGNSGKMRGYLVQPAGEGPFPAVLIVHENRGLNPHIEDVARRAAVEGFLALAPDALYPLGGYPGNDDDGKVLQRKLDRQKIHVDMLNGAKFLKAHELSNGNLGATGLQGLRQQFPAGFAPTQQHLFFLNILQAGQRQHRLGVKSAGGHFSRQLPLPQFRGSGAAYRQPVHADRPLRPEIRHGGQRQSCGIGAGEKDPVIQIQIHQDAPHGRRHRQGLDQQGRAMARLIPRLPERGH